MLGLIKLEHTAVVHLNGTHLPNDKLTRHFTSRECPYSGVFPFQIIRSRNRKKPRGSPLRKIYDHCTVAMSKGKDDGIASDVPEMLSVLHEFKEKTSELLVHVKRIRGTVSVEDFSTVQGVSLLELKCHLLLDYVINLSLLMLNKIQGQLIAGSSPVDRLIELRVVLEKLRPLDHKFRYQIDKLVRASSVGVSGSDPLSFRPNPHNLISKADEVSSGDEGTTSEVYVPPKVVAMPYAEDSHHRQGKNREKRYFTASSSLMKELRAEYSEAPEEQDTGPSSLGMRRELLQEKEQQEYEEEFFVRIGKRKKTSGRSAVSNLGEIVQFGHLNSKDNIPKTKKRKKSLKKKLKRFRHRF